MLVNSVPDFYRLQKRTLLTDKFKIDMEGHRYPAAFVAFDCLYAEGHVTVGVTKDTVEALEVTGQNPFAFSPMMKEGVVWVRPNRVCVVEYMPNLNQALRQPCLGVCEMMLQLRRCRGKDSIAFDF